MLVGAVGRREEEGRTDFFLEEDFVRDVGHEWDFWKEGSFMFVSIFIDRLP